jgi:Tuberculosis necrotizing toxin
LRRLSLLATVAALTVFALPAAAASKKPTQCDGSAPIGTVAAKGCFRRDWRLGPKRLPKPPDPIGRLTRGYHRFGKLTRAHFLRRFWNGSPKSGGWRYPANSGFAGPAFLVQIAPGTLVDRFGSPYGTFLSPAGTPYAMRAIPPSNLDTYPGGAAYNYHVYRVTAVFTVQAGAIARWFGQRGGVSSSSRATATSLAAGPTRSTSITCSRTAISWS